MFLEVRDVAGLIDSSAVRRAEAGEGKARCVGLEVQGETAAGENFGSTFLMVKAHFQDDAGGKFAVPAVCKKLPPTEYLRKTFNVDVSFPKEVNFYRIVIPAMESLQRDLHIAEEQRIKSFPKMFGARIGSGEDPSIVDDDAILVLEDLREAGYRCGDRNNGLDIEHCRVAVRELARFHALGIALRRLRPAVFDDAAFRKTCVYFMHDQEEAADAVLVRFAKNSLTLVEKELSAVVDKERLRRAALMGQNKSSVAGPFDTVIHEDFWVNNMMFGYDADGRPDRIKMVDFQLTNIGSAARDLLFLLYTSADSASLARADELIKEYHDELVRYARLHGLDVGDLGWDAFQKDLADAAKYEFSHIFVMICIIRAQAKVEKADSHSDAVFSSQIGVSDTARTRYIELVADFVKQGWM